MRVYTLEEANQILTIKEHKEWGHDWDELKAGDKVVALRCMCGAEAVVSEPKIPEGREVHD